jgi:hypothetical protein
MQLIESKQTPKPQPSKMKTNTKLLPINKKEFTFGIQTTPQTTKSLFFGHSVSLCRARDSLSPNNPKMPLSFHFEIPSVVLSLKLKFLFFFFSISKTPSQVVRISKHPSNSGHGSSSTSPSGSPRRFQILLRNLPRHVSDVGPHISLHVYAIQR